MAQIYITADSIKPSNHLVEQAYSYGPGPTYLGQVLIDSATDAQQASMLPASTFGVFAYQSAIYALAATQQAPNRAIRMFRSTDSGTTWAELDAGNGPLFQNGSGYFDGDHTVYVAFRANNTTSGAINLKTFNLATGVWSATFGTSGAPTAVTAGMAVFLRPDNTLLVLYGNRNTFNAPDPSGIEAVAYDIGAASWGVPFDVGAALLGLPGWDATQTLVSAQTQSSYMDTDGTIGVFFNTSSVQVSPVIWGNRCFYQQIAPDNSLGSFEDFPNQDVVVSGKQDLEAFTGSPMGRPILLQASNVIVLPVLMNNRLQTNPHQLAGVYLGAPISAPTWTLDTSLTLDPAALLDTTIWPQQAPAMALDEAGARMYAVFNAQDSDGQNQARLRLAFSSDLVAPASGWSAQTIFDLQVDAAPGFNFSQQILAAPSINIPAAVDDCTALWWF